MQLFLAYTTLTGLLLASKTAGYTLDSKCYNSPGEDAVSMGTNMYQTQGSCQQTCLDKEMAVFGVKGFNCYCAKALPGKDAVVDDKECNVACPGYPQNCGGDSAYKLGLTGADGSDTAPVPIEGAEPSSSANVTTSTIAGATSYITTTETPSGTASSSKSGGGSKAGVAAGVVCGVILVIALGVGAFLTIRRRRRLQAEEEYRQAVATKEFVTSIRKPANDSRLDPVILNQRRLSDGSIADNEDYSRRILKVTNPDNS